MTTICGHDRDTLRRLLNLFVIDLLDERSAQASVDHADTTQMRGQSLETLRSTIDPAKLAAVIAELMRERGLVVSADPCADDPWLVFADGNDDGIGIVAPKFAKTIPMPQARAFVLAILDSPQATLQDIERMIGEL